MRKTLLPVLAATIWISISEFVRNEFLLKDHWVDHYSAMGLDFPSEPVNGAVWGLWSLCYAGVIFVISKKFNLLQTTTLSWFLGFVLMWLVAGNLMVLPYDILPYAIPLSMIEAFVAAFIVEKLK